MSNIGCSEGHLATALGLAISVYRILYILSCHDTDIVQYTSVQYSSDPTIVRPAPGWPVLILQVFAPPPDGDM